MKERFLQFIEKHALLPEGSRVLLAVSGGIDSVALAHLFSETHIPFGIAHCNFQLREQESLDDAVFVEDLAKKLKVPFYCRSFQTLGFAKEHKLSIQMAARELRYQWFEEIRQEESYDLIATGHQRDDQIETFFINLFRGTGLPGLRGFPLKNGSVIRPILFLSRKEITEYVHSKGILFREDSSNQALYYERNLVRQQLIPLIEKLQPNFGNIMEGNFKRLREAEEIMLNAILQEKEKLIRYHENAVSIDLASLKKLMPLNTYLYYFLKEFNFNPDSVEDIINSMDSPESRVFFSNQYFLTKERDQLLIRAIQEHSSPADKISYSVELPAIRLNEKESPHFSWMISEPLSLRLSMVYIPEGIILIRDENIAQIDLDNVAGPLTIRKWMEGDSFNPLGMRGKKKISDYFIDNKFSDTEKKSSWLLCCGDKIVWLIGKRLDEHFKIKSSTRRMLKIEILQY